MNKYTSRITNNNHELLEGCEYDRYIFRDNVWGVNKLSWKAFTKGCLINVNIDKYRCSYPFIYETEVCDRGSLNFNYFITID